MEEKTFRQRDGSFKIEKFVKLNPQL